MFSGSRSCLIRKKLVEKIPHTKITPAAPRRHFEQMSSTRRHSCPKPPETFEANDIHFGERIIYQTTEVLLVLQF